MQGYAVEQGQSRLPPPKRTSRMHENKWALRKCSHCHEVSFCPSRLGCVSYPSRRHVPQQRRPPHTLDSTRLHVIGSCLPLFCVHNTPRAGSFGSHAQLEGSERHQPVGITRYYHSTTSQVVRSVNFRASGTTHTYCCTSIHGARVALLSAIRKTELG